MGRLVTADEGSTESNTELAFTSWQLKVLSAINSLSFVVIAYLCLERCSATRACSDALVFALLCLFIVIVRVLVLRKVLPSRIALWRTYKAESGSSEFSDELLPLRIAISTLVTLVDIYVLPFGLALMVGYAGQPLARLLPPYDVPGTWLFGPDALLGGQLPRALSIFDGNVAPLLVSTGLVVVPTLVFILLARRLSFTSREWTGVPLLGGIGVIFYIVLTVIAADAPVAVWLFLSLSVRTSGRVTRWVHRQLGLQPVL